MKTMQSLKIKILNQGASFIPVERRKFVRQKLLNKQSWCLLKSKFPVDGDCFNFTRENQMNVWTKRT